MRTGWKLIDTMHDDCAECAQAAEQAINTAIVLGSRQATVRFNGDTREHTATVRRTS